MTIVGILNAGRNSFSFFLLLIVCLGYGVVKPTLGKTMVYVRWLAAAHFVFGLVYSITAFMVKPESAGEFQNAPMPQAQRLTRFRSLSVARCSSPGQHLDCFLYLDSQRAQLHSQGSERAKTTRKGSHVQKVVVGDSHQCYRDIWLLFLQQFLVRVSQRPRLCSFPLEDQMVYP